MIPLLLASLAWGQSAADCLNQDSFPLAGTSGYRNGLEALRISAATYNATDFIEDRVFPAARAELRGRRDKDAPYGPMSEWETIGSFAYEIHTTYGATRVPLWQTGADCPAEYRLADRPMDLSVAQLAAAGRWGRVGFFFSSAVVYGNVGESRNQTRIGLGILNPFIATYALYTTPFSGQTQVIQGSTSYATDFVGGVSVDLDYAELRAGYTASAGWYLSMGEHRTGAFGNLVAKDGLQRIDQFAVGAKRPELLRNDKVGTPSLFARQVPFNETPTEDPATGERTTLVDKLLTGHLRQEDMFGYFDVGFGYAIRPTPSLYDVRIAGHSKGYNDPDAEVASAQWNISAGMVNLPTRHYYGLDGGQYVHVKGEIKGALTRPNGRSATPTWVRFSLFMNDEEQLAVFPFAYNALTWRLAIDGPL